MGSHISSPGWMRSMAKVTTAVAMAVAAAMAVLPLAQAEIPRACTPSFQHLPFCNMSLSLHTRVEDLLERLSLADKALLLTARASPAGNVSSIGLPEYNWGANCVHGVQSTCGTHCATSFPNPVNLGAIFDPQVVADMAQVIGWELRALWLEGARENPKHPHVGLDCWSPNININRDPRWGRNMETPSEDPYVNGLFGVAYTKGLQRGKDPRYLQAVVTLKHWAAYSFEHYHGVDRRQFDAKVSKYDLVDTYLPAFRTSVIDGGAKGIMCSYNSLNGVPTCANAYLTGVLRDLWGFDGYITSDSGAVQAIFDMHHYTTTRCDAAKVALEQGTDINSGNVYRSCVEQLVKEEKLPQHYVDDAIRRTLRLRFELGLFDTIEDQPYWHVLPSEVGTDQAKELSLRATKQSLVLLQNSNGTLPLRKKSSTVAVIGPHAQARKGMMGNYYGQICHGDYHELGCVESPLEAIQRIHGKDKTVFAAGCSINGTSSSGISAAVATARKADVVVLFLGIDTTIEREASDRETIELPHIQLELLKRVRRENKPTVVVLFNGGIVGVEELVLHCDSLVEAFYPGFFGAQAIAEVLFGHHNPSGKLPVTMYRSNYIETVSMSSMDMTKFPGRSYRYFKELPVFPFGWGLSYTTFNLAALGSTDTDIALVTSELNATFRVSLSNAGSLAGGEVVFAFFRPLTVNTTGPATLLNQQLFFFKRVELDAKQSIEIDVHVNENALALVDEDGNLCLFPGFYEVIVTNGVEERLTFALRLGGRQRILRPFPQPPHASAKSPISRPAPPSMLAAMDASDLANEDNVAIE